jgi:hypothetical protein
VARGGWLAAYRSGRDLPDERLDDFIPLYERMKEESGFTPSANVGADVQWLNRCRNDFVHYRPRSWLIEVSGLPRIASNVLSVVAYLARDEQHIRWIDTDARERAHSEILRLSALLAEGSTDYAA